MLLYWLAPHSFSEYLLLAGRVHVMNDKVVDPVEAFRKVNVLGTERLARMAAKAGVKRFIFISSVKVNGEGSQVFYTEKDTPAPQDAYGISKREAEDSLVCIAKETGVTLRKGEEISYFQFGGSDCIVIFQSSANICFSAQTGTHYKVGNKIAQAYCVI